MAYIRAAASGNYSAPATWVGGVVPTTGDVACSGSFRVTLDVPDILATLSDCNEDWVAAGGATLATTHSGGFSTTQGLATNIFAMRYSLYKSTATSVTSAALVLKGGDVTVGSMVQITDGASNNTGVHIIRCDWGTYTPNNITLGDITPLSYAGTWASGSYLLANTITLADMGVCNLTTGRFLDAAGLGTRHGLVTWGASSGVLNWVATGVIPRGSNTSYYTVYVATQCNFTYDLPADTQLEVQTLSSSLTGYAIQMSNVVTFTVLRSVIATHRYGASVLLFLYTPSSSALGVVTFNGNLTIINAAFLDVSTGAQLTVQGATNITCSTTNKVLMQASSQLYSRAWTFNGLVTLNMTVSGGYSSAVLTLPRDAPVTFNAGVTVLGYAVLWMSLSYGAALDNTVPITIVGNLDASAVTVSSISSTYSSIIGSQDNASYNVMRTINITGDVRAPLTSTVTSTNITNGVLAFMSMSNSGTTSVTIGGNLVPGVIPCIAIARAFTPQITVNGSIVASASAQPAVASNVGVVVTPIVCNGVVKPASNGIVPITAPWRLGASGQVYVYDQSGVDRYVEATTGIVPAASDVRRGVSVGSSVGTLAVPNAGQVLKDIPVDSGVGTLDLFNTITALLHQLQGGDTQFRQLDPLWDSVRVHTSVNQDGKLFSAGYNGGFFPRGATSIDSGNTLFGRPTLKLGNAAANCLETVQNSTATKPFTTGGENFCLEAWVRPTAMPASLGMLFTDTANINVEFTPTGYVGVWLGLNGTYDLSSVPLTLNVWTHVAVARNGSTLTLYFNGVAVMTRAITVSTLVGTSYWMFGMPSWNSTYLFTGNVAELTMTVGSPRYTAAFTPNALPYPYSTLTTSLATAPVSALLYNIAQKTDKLGFDASNNVLAAATVDMSGLTPRFNTIDASLTTANTGITAGNNAIAGVKAKTDQLTFGAGGVVAQTGSTDYTARFDTLEAQVSVIPTLTYSASFTGINTKLDTLQATVSSGGVDLTPVTNAIATLDGKVGSVKTKTDQLTFTTGGVVADVEVSVQSAIDYTEQFTEITSKLDNVQLVTDTFQFNADGVVASATVDLSNMVGRFDAIDAAVAALPVTTHTDAQYTTLFNQLNVIGNATGAIDLTPIMTSLSQIYTSVENVPRLTYSASFVGVNTKLDALAAATVDVDLTPVLDAITAIPAPNLTPITNKIDAMQVDVTTIKDAALRIEGLSSGIRDSLSTATGVDLSGVEHQLTLLNSKFDGVDAPVQVVPTGDAGTTVLYAHCKHPDGTPVEGQVATLHIMQVVGEGVLLPDHTMTSTSGADGLLSFVLPRDAGISAMFEYGGRKERVVLVGEPTQPLPSIVAKL